MTDDTRQEAVERGLKGLQGWLWSATDGQRIAERVIDASGLLDANNQLRQRLTEAEGLLDRLAVYLRWYDSLPGRNPLHMAYDAYRTKVHTGAT